MLDSQLYICTVNNILSDLNNILTLTSYNCRLPSISLSSNFNALMS